MPCGHRFEWFNSRCEPRFADPPPECQCTYCGARFDSILDHDIHHCWVKMRMNVDEMIGGLEVETV